MLDRIPLDEARGEAKEVMENVIKISDNFCADKRDHENEETRELLEDVSYNIMKIAVEEELKR